jgi:PAS domain-containing protein
MTGYEVELILMRELASCLATPVFLVDPAGTLIYYNEQSEKLLGRRFDETGEMPAAEWGTIFTPIDDAGNPISPEALPLVVALRDQSPSYKTMRIQALDGVQRRLQVAAIPIIGRADRLLGAVALFWEQ